MYETQPVRRGDSSCVALCKHWIDRRFRPCGVRARISGAYTVITSVIALIDDVYSVQDVTSPPIKLQAVPCSPIALPIDVLVAVFARGFDLGAVGCNVTTEKSGTPHRHHKGYAQILVQ